ncbi:CBO0543 family protein [Bacillus piscicola]|uniref:CBO0543 family protein n=1 Tax=Bacillus piscicola TaxID=1632684 RepID=UPI00308452C6
MGKFVPKNKLRHAHFSFLSKQATTQLFGLIVVSLNLIEYPKRFLFKHTYKGSFSFEYFLFPVLSVMYNLYYPDHRNILVRALYNLFHTSLLTGIEQFIVTYTGLIHYKKWTWYVSFITIGISNLLSHAYYKWFFKNTSGGGSS